MVEAQAASAPTVTPPSMGPPTIAYVPPMTLGEAVVRARTRIRHRNRRAARILIVALAVFTLPLLQGYSALFPSDPMVKVTSTTTLYAWAVTALFLFFCWAAYRILTDRTGITYVALGVGAATVAYYAYEVWALVGDYQVATLTRVMDPVNFYESLINPVLACATGALAIAAGLVAMPRPVPIADSA